MSKAVLSAAQRTKVGSSASNDIKNLARMGLVFGIGLRSGDVIAADVSVVVAGVHLSLNDGTSHWDFVGVGRSVRHRPLAQSSKIRWVCAVRINQRNGVMVAVQFVVDFIVGDDLASVYIVVRFRLGQEFPGL